jgi:hypothetical protein
VTSRTALRTRRSIMSISSPGVLMCWRRASVYGLHVMALVSDAAPRVVPLVRAEGE